VENFLYTKSILVKTRKAQSQSKLNKLNYFYLLSISLINRNVKLKPFNVYDVYLSNELLEKTWKFYGTLVPYNLGLVSSNYHKSVLASLCSNSSALSTLPSSAYLVNFESYHFHTVKDIFKKFIVLFMNIFSSSHTSYNISFDTYNSYLWLNWYLKLNPMNNVFYLKVYNY
jgi:hypothetical protein